ncbi:MAG: bifunctional UDP-N-acetylglucosamine diphosphorylase/glucosamine-1-phosphate N-acetyltransferase GlmU [Alphaproteobacteria bacterium]|nr:bifunctional UDP-N-acetylglucosamine diphosphorylase/glucosamine-1-phosphate N-acetyltransferase GlmU [Alphaproteobacteria bacterium]MDE2629775.1 bifunctional UDP-N-acetylglucosamine diphosphorylase/glucosamine-1-phosphate N-acetyltransferase GlmU [Alphaproteobacteria bacterium]
MTRRTIETSMARAGIVLAAGQGTRMKSATPKVMHTVAGLPILGHVIAAMRAAGVERIVVVTHKEGEDVRAFAAKSGAGSVVQEPQLGTGHAAACAAAALAGFSGKLIVAYGDMPLVAPATFEASFAAQAKAGMAMIGFRPKDPAAYGRMILDGQGFLDRIVEFRDANARERAESLCNAGILAADAKEFFRCAAKLGNDNAQKEYYLTDVPRLAKGEGVRCAVVEADETEMMGVNSRAELAAAEAAMQSRLRVRALAGAVGMTAPDTVFLSYDTVLEADVQVEPYVIFAPGVAVRAGARIRAFSHLEGAEVGAGAIVGPYARLRPGTVLEENAHVGNFVEVKNSRVEKGAKANHLTYLGDARVGAGANIGAGTITCNYDGFDKHRTDIGAGAFIGSDTALVAPVKVGAGAIVGAGSVVTKDVAAGSLVLTRAEQKEIPGWAEKFQARKKASKAAKSKDK